MAFCSSRERETEAPFRDEPKKERLKSSIKRVDSLFPPSPSHPNVPYCRDTIRGSVCKI